MSLDRDVDTSAWLLLSHDDDDGDEEEEEEKTGSRGPMHARTHTHTQCVTSGNVRSPTSDTDQFLLGIFRN